jgi:hypothetical protein
VTQNADRSPTALYVGLGRTSYMDCCNWGQLFCTAELAAREPISPISLDLP